MKLLKEGNKPSFFSYNVGVIYIIPSRLRDLWIKKVDAMEEYYQTIKGLYPIIDESFPYYIGMGEMAIYLLNDIFYFDSSNERYNFLEKEFSEKIKSLFWKYDKDYCIQFISSYIYSYQWDLVFAILFYPSYYFSLLEDVFLNIKKPEELSIYINRVDEYENLLKEILLMVSYKVPLKKYSTLVEYFH